MDPQQPFAEAGLDSIGSVEIRNAASALVGRELPVTVAFDYPSVASIAKFIVSQMQPPGIADAPQQLASTSDYFAGTLQKIKEVFPNFGILVFSGVQRKHARAVPQLDNRWSQKKTLPNLPRLLLSFQLPPLAISHYTV